MLVDTVARRLVWYGNDTMIDLPNRRAFTRLLAETWPGWRVDWAFDGIGDIAAYVGVDRAAVRSVDRERLTADPTAVWELDSPLLADDAEPEVNLQGSYRLLTVRTDDGVRSWVLDHPDDGHPAWLGPGLLERLPGPGHPRVRLAGLPDVGLHLDVPARTAGVWVGWTCPGLLAEVDDRWPGWTVTFWGDRFESQVEAASGTVVVPVVDEARALTMVARSLTRHTDPLASFAASVDRARADGRTVEVNPVAWQHTDTLSTGNPWRGRWNGSPVRVADLRRSGSFGPVFDGFTLDQVDVGEVTLRVRYGGAGPPVVLLHGHPRTHTTWHAVAARLAAHHTVVARRPARVRRFDAAAGRARPRAVEQAGDGRATSSRLMTPPRSRAVRGGRPRPRRAGRVPDARWTTRSACRTWSSWTGCRSSSTWSAPTPTFARAWWHWWFLGQTDKPAERVICADPDAWYRTPEPDGDGPGQSRRPVGGAARSRRRARHVRGLPRRPGHRPGPRRGRPGRRPAGRGARRCCWSPRSDDLDIHGDPAAIWAPVAGRAAAPPGHRQRPPPGRGGARPGRRRAARLPRVCRSWTSGEPGGQRSSTITRVVQWLDRD